MTVAGEGPAAADDSEQEGTGGDVLAAFARLDAYTVSDAARRVGVGGVIDGLRPETLSTEFVGRARTSQLRFEPNGSVPMGDYGGAAFFDSIHSGEVGILDGGGLQLTALGDLAIAMAKMRGAVGVVVNARIRDAEAIEALQLPVFAAGTGLTSAAGKGYITGLGEPVIIESVRIEVGDLVMGCRGGIVVVPWQFARQVLVDAERQAASDLRVRESMDASSGSGQPFEEIWRRWK